MAPHKAAGSAFAEPQPEFSEPVKGSKTHALAQGLHGADHREESDGYRGEVFRQGDYRIAACRDGIQWLFQRRRGGKSLGGARWRTLGYCATRKGLMRLSAAHMGAAPDLAGLPPTCGRGAGHD